MAAPTSEAEVRNALPRGRRPHMARPGRRVFAAIVVAPGLSPHGGWRAAADGLLRPLEDRLGTRESRNNIGNLRSMPQALACRLPAQM